MSRLITFHSPGNVARYRPLLCVGSAVMTLFCITFTPVELQADLVKLANGGELRGKIISGSDSKQLIRLETLTGATIVVERAKTQFVTLRSLSIEEYETRLKRLDNTWESHWDLAEWCRKKSLTTQRETHLRRVTELFPDHDKAQSALGRVWNKGNWVDRDQLMASQGYVKYKNKYITPQELEVIENTTEELERERSWSSKVRVWHGWLDDEKRATKGLSSLNEITDPHAAPAVMRYLSVDSRVGIRELAVSILVKISGPKAASGLVKFWLFDESKPIRDAALAAIGRENSEVAQNALMKALKNDSNAIVCRAAVALGQIGDQRTITPLIDALTTMHDYQVSVDVPGNQVYSFSSDGNFASNNPPIPPAVLDAVSKGHLLPPVIQYDSPPPPKRTVSIRVEHSNAEVLAALGKLTQQNFGYDKRTWKLWWAAEKNSGAKLNKSIP